MFDAMRCYFDFKSHCRPTFTKSVVSCTPFDCLQEPTAILAGVSAFVDTLPHADKHEQQAALVRIIVNWFVNVNF